ncbi:GTPase IMAP family member 1 [Biomphalaria pfeifferi]|uniref:GTPase IMAP family member 1 n=1 Tax=Biomphalaria pfeifferi TaxID=112525 RepID=A0AAD8B8H9_BIOPF|nr:GTPase IMAP family member 1 [Biomphalaria pfeifferi]
MANGGTITALKGSSSTEEDIHLDKERKVILIVGRTGNGKRSIGNSLLGGSRFETEQPYYPLVGMGAHRYSDILSTLFLHH